MHSPSDSDVRGVLSFDAMTTSRGRERRSTRGGMSPTMSRALSCVVCVLAFLLVAIFFQGQILAFTRSRSYVQTLGIEEMIRNLDATGTITGRVAAVTENPALQDDKADERDEEEDVLPDVQQQKKEEELSEKRVEQSEQPEPEPAPEPEPEPAPEPEPEPEPALAPEPAPVQEEESETFNFRENEEDKPKTPSAVERMHEMLRTSMFDRTRRQAAQTPPARQQEAAEDEDVDDSGGPPAPAPRRRKPRGMANLKMATGEQLAERRKSACVAEDVPSWNPFDAQQAKELLERNMAARPTPQSNDYRARLARGLLNVMEDDLSGNLTLRRGRSLLQSRSRRSSGLAVGSKPLMGRCASERSVRKSIRGPAEEALARCLKSTQERRACSAADEEMASAAASNLASVKMLKKSIKCLMVNAKGCGSTSGNVETASQGTLSASSKPKEDIQRGFRTCALVGNGPGLTFGQKGAAIDAHDAVFRFNFYAKSSLSGTKTSFRVFNKKRAEIISGPKVNPTEGESFLFWNYGSLKFMNRIRSAHRDSYIFSPEMIKHLITTYFALRKDLRRLGMPPFGCPSNLNSGLHGLFVATSICDRVSLFGFSYTTSMIAARLDAVSPRLSRFHDWSADTVVLRLLALAGAIDICP